MIRSFADRETEKLFQREFSRKFPPDIQRRARIKLEILDAAESLEDLRLPPSNHLEQLSGDRSGQYSQDLRKMEKNTRFLLEKALVEMTYCVSPNSIRVNRQWRICFVWKEGNAYNIELVDYH